MPAVHIERDAPEGLDDFVLYVKTGDPAVRDLTALAEKFGSPTPELDIEVTLQDDWKGRGLACKCNSGSYWSIALRRDPTLRGSVGVPYTGCEIPPSAASTGVRYAFRASRDHWPDEKAPLFSVADLVEPLYQLIFQKHAEPHGLIAITGSTGSAKSQIARGLLYRLVEPRLKADGASPRPHILTIEKPIECPFIRCEDGEPIDLVEQQKYGIDFTPRLLETDCTSLRDALNAALRQKPFAVFVDEVRDVKDWEAVLRFAASGHLIITTAHAGSLTEAMSWIFNSARAQTPADRGDIAERILALVHMRRDAVSLPKKLIQTPETIRFLLPSLWRNTGSGISALVEDYLSSLLPNNTLELNPCSIDHSSIGRSWFAQYLIAKRECNQHSIDCQKVLKSLKPELLQTALEADLGGR